MYFLCWPVLYNARHQGWADLLDTSAAKAQATLLDAWQRSLPLIDEALQGDRLVDVVDIKASKTVVVTARHVALLRVRVERQPHTNYHQLTQRRAEANGNMAYRKQWMVPIARVQSVNGDPDYLKCTLNVVDRLKLGPAQVQVPRRRLLQCSSQILYEQLLSAINVSMQVYCCGCAPCNTCIRPGARGARRRAARWSGSAAQAGH